MAEVRIFDQDGTPRAVLEDATAEVTVELGGLGGGTLSVPAHSAKLRDDPTLLDDGNLVEVRDGAVTTTWVIDGAPERTFLEDGQPLGEPVQVTLAGALALLSRAAVDAENGMSERAADLRPFGPARAGYDDSAWVAPASGGTVVAPDFPRDTTYPTGWDLDDGAEYIHPVSDGSATVDPGRGLLRAEFTVATATELTVQVTADDELPTLWVAGRQPFAPILGLHQWKRTFTETIPGVAAGTYAVFAVVNNLDRPAGLLNIAHLLLSIGDADGNVLLSTDTATWKAFPTYPIVTMPGETAGVILEVLTGEAQTRGSLPAELQLGFTATQDSGGVAWAHETAWSWRVRQDSLLSVLIDLMSLVTIEHAAITITDTGPRLDVWQSYGTDLSAGAAPVRLLAGQAVERASEGRQPPGANDIWTRTAGGWTHHDDTDAQLEHGVIEGGDVVGVASAPENYGQAGTSTLRRTSPRPRQRITVADTDQVAAGRDWWIGDTVVVERVAW